MMKITDIPNEVYETALEYEDLESWGLDRAKEAYNSQTFKRGWTEAGLEKAIFDYITMRGNFDEEKGKYAGTCGYTCD